MAESYGLDYLHETFEPGSRPVQIAFHLVGCGADLLWPLTDKNEFPSESRRVRRRGSRWVRHEFNTQQARRAAVLLAQAMATLLCEATARAGQPGSAQIHSQLQALIQDIYPLDEQGLALVDNCRAEYDIFKTHKVREEVRLGIETGTGYHRALLDPSFNDGISPDEDLNLVEVQESYAPRYLRGTATLSALKMIVGIERFESIDADLVHPGGLSASLLPRAAADAAGWNVVAESWQQFASLARGAAEGDAS